MTIHKVVVGSASASCRLPKMFAPGRFVHSSWWQPGPTVTSCIW